MTDERGSILPLLIVVAMFLLSLKGGDPHSPGPAPVNKADAEMAESAGRAYLEGVSEVYLWAADELSRDPELVGSIGGEIKLRVDAKRESASLPLRERMQELSEDGVATERALRSFAHGMRGLAE